MASVVRQAGEGRGGKSNGNLGNPQTALKRLDASLR